ncbi:MAG: (2Fe-2S)-binding protein [Saprospiraceae bacterium]|nr:(2Fe-2S)-binding protein [Saprospiraceae bacterium]
MKLNINGQSYQVDVSDQMPVLWVLRDLLEMNGTKYGCGIGQCGACTIHVDGQPSRACLLPVGDLAGKEITTIEGLSKAASLHPLQKAWIQIDVPQCGYCQSGQIMQAAALLAENAQPSPAEIDKHMNGNLCRCGTYLRIRKAIQAAAQDLS